MAENAPKRKIKDSVFTDLFQDRRYLLRLYQALHPEDSSVSEDDLADVTLKHVLVDAGYNDLGFSVGNRLMVLVESQSTWTMNIVIRALMYLVQTYHDYFKRTKQNLYSSKKVAMPKPELYVIYTGDRKKIPDTISLAEEFFQGEHIAIDAEVKVLYRESEKDIIGQYIIFSKVYDEQRKLYGQKKEAVTETIRICKDRNVLKEYLDGREQEVVDMLMTLFDDDYILEAYAEEIRSDTEKKTEKKVTEKVTEKVTKEVTRKVTKETAKKTATIMIKMGKLSLDEIASCVPDLSMAELRKLEAKVLRRA